ncbi:MAG: hypothetical protein ABIE14_02310, partial [Patescibacteria group bacterium]
VTEVPTSNKNFFRESIQDLLNKICKMTGGVLQLGREDIAIVNTTREQVWEALKAVNPQGFSISIA